MKHVSTVAYFADDSTRVYQLMQWLPVLEVLDGAHPTAVVVRDASVAEVLRERTSLEVLLAPGFPELRALYARLDAKVVLYCNNSMLNFQSLLESRMLHLHVGHGESDKQSMASNNAKAYDRVLVAGEAAVQRHLAALMELDASRLVRVGRPQLDVPREPVLAPSGRRTVLYAPTWEGDADYNDYTSVDVMGAGIVDQLLSVPDVRVVYKPHPKVVTSRRPAVREGHHAVLAAITAASMQDPAAGHLSLTTADVLAVMTDCDAIVTDVSSVGLDWLYLRTEKPLVLTDKHADPDRLREEVPVSRCADVVTPGDVPALGALVADRLERDEHHLARVAMRHHYFDDLAVGDSTTRFLALVEEMVVLRDRLLGVTPLDQGPAEITA
ncbi:CDP-glycerol glycerophosphotransferase family protein [uncultured Nocardioides sp.]|uniref:CDP-glycerol glycerophosphotransferase family protein n=1 Tax=uncultured Nocardioides sp. TaxID=198441 RepID=UPI00262A6C26|nr:CDP-glycerol glycerophosphotransferase family protein [uncultured Nocardioides sp.]